MVGQKAHPRFPVTPIRAVNEHNWDNERLAGLHQGERFEPFIHGSEAAGKKSESMRLLHEVQLAGEEVIEINQLGIPMNDFIGALLEGQPNVQTETVFAP